MSLNSSDKNILNILLNTDSVLKNSYCSWFFDNEEIFVSKGFQEIIGIGTSVLDPKTFVQAMKSTFGDFLTTAIEKISTLSINEYSSLVKSSKNFANEKFVLKLTVDKKKMFYIIVAEKVVEKIAEKRKISQENKMFEDEIIDKLPIHIWQKNKDSKIVYCNKKYADALETTKNLAIANNLKLISSSVTQKAYRIDQCRPYSSRPKIFTEHVIIHGERRSLNVTEFPSLGDSVSLCFAIDITDAEDVKKNYKIYKKNTEEILESISIPIAIFNEKMNLIFANNAVKKLFSVESSFLNTERNFAEIFDLLYDQLILIDVNNFQQYKEQAIKFFTMVTEPHHTLVHLQNGKTVAVTTSPDHSGGLLFLFEDISSRLALEREVNSLYAVQKETLEQLIEGIFVFGIDNKIKMINTAAKKIWGKDVNKNYDNVPIKHFFEESASFFHSHADLELWIDQLINITSKRTEFADTISLLSDRSLDYGYVPLPDGLHLIKFFDSTNMTKVEKSLNKQNNIIANVEKIKTDLISNITYETEAPLNTITGFVEILTNRYFGQLNKKQEEFCHGISDSAKKLQISVEKLVKASCIEAGKLKIIRKKYNLLNFLNNISAQYQSRNCQLVVEFFDEKFFANFDEQAIGYAVVNILPTFFGSSFKKSVTATVDVRLENFSIKISNPDLTLTKDQIEKSNSLLSNDSEPMPSLINQIIKEHDGSISITCEKNTGTAVCIVLPVC